MPCAIQRNLQTEFKENKKTSESLIPIGTRVFTRNRISGRNKIQDTYCSIPYKVLIYFGDNIQLADRSGLFKNAIRKKILGTREKVDSNGIAKHLTERSTVTYLQCYRPVD